jgi:putative transcriptional regulator
MEKELFNKLLTSAKEIAEIEKGRKAPESVTLVFEDGTKINIKNIREKMNLSRTQFSKALGVGSRTIESWEQGLRTPSGAARSLLKIAHSKPDIFKKELVL